MQAIIVKFVKTNSGVLQLIFYGSELQGKKNRPTALSTSIMIPLVCMYMKLKVMKHKYILLPTRSKCPTYLVHCSFVKYRGNRQGCEIGLIYQNHFIIFIYFINIIYLFQNLFRHTKVIKLTCNFRNQYFVTKIF